MKPIHRINIQKGEERPNTHGSRGTKNAFECATSCINLYARSCVHARQSTVLCARILEATLTVADYCTVVFFLRMAAYEGFVGEAINEARQRVLSFLIEQALFAGTW